MQEYIVDIGSLFSGRTIRLEADDASEALIAAKAMVKREQFERVIQIRDDRGLFHYDYRFGVIDE